MFNPPPWPSLLATAVGTAAALSLLPARPAAAIECSPVGGPVINNSPCCPIFTRTYANSVPDPPALPADTGLALDDPGEFLVPFECTNRKASDASCDPNIALVPDGMREQGKLFFWLPGLYNGPDNNRHILYMAAYAGFDVLSVSWDTQSAAFSRCTPNETTLTFGGVCDPDDDCADILHEEMWTGVDDPATPHDTTESHPSAPQDWEAGYTGRYWSSIERRATRALQALDEADTNDDHHWADYCEPDDTYGSRLTYEDVVMAGGSMGGSQAQWLYYTRSVEALEDHIAEHGDPADTGLPQTPPPPVAVHGLWGAELFGDFCDVPTDLSDGRPTPYYYEVWDDDDHADGTLRPIPIGKTFIAIHTSTPNWPNQSHTHPDYEDLPLTFEPLGVGDENRVWSYEDTGQVTLGTDTILLTDQEPANNKGLHASMMSDEALPNALLNGFDEPPGADTEDVYLFDGYVEGLCSVGVFDD